MPSAINSAGGSHAQPSLEWGAPTGRRCLSFDGSEMINLAPSQSLVPTVCERRNGAVASISGRAIPHESRLLEERSGRAIVAVLACTSLQEAVLCVA